MPESTSVPESTSAPGTTTAPTTAPTTTHTRTRAEPPIIDGIRHKRFARFPAGVLYAPNGFTSPDGSYDLLIHFHGEPQIVRESAEHAGLNALVAVINIGNSSDKYQGPYATRALYELLLEHIDAAAHRRGLAFPRLRRIALSSWSAGYSALRAILAVADGAHRPDAVFVLDGLHCDWREGGQTDPNAAQLASFLTTAQRAAEGRLLFEITHSENDLHDYVSTRDAAHYLLARAAPGVEVVHGAVAPRIDVRLPSTGAVIEARYSVALDQLDDERLGLFRVESFRGRGIVPHFAHLLQMAGTVLPDLVARWSRVE